MELDRVSVGILDLNLPAAGASLDVVAKTNALTKLSSRTGSAAAAASTNLASAASSKAAPAPVESDDEAEEDKPPQIDATLNETQHILVDYLGILAKEGVLASHH